MRIYSFIIYIFIALLLIKIELELLTPLSAVLLLT